MTSGKTSIMVSAVAIVTFAIGLVFGAKWLRDREPEAQPKQKKTPSVADPEQIPPVAKAEPPSVHVECETATEQLLADAGQLGAVVRYEGNQYLKVWVETEIDGVRSEWINLTTAPFILDSTTTQREGRIVWLRFPTSIPGRERWTMALRAGLKGKDPGVASTLGTKDAVVQTSDMQTGSSMEANVFWKKGATPPKSMRPLPSPPLPPLPAVIPPNKAVCIKEYWLISDQSERDIASRSIRLLGSAAMPGMSLQTLPDLFAHCRADGICRIRLMCRLWPEEKR